MYNDTLIGKTLSEAVELLKADNITDVSVVKNEGKKPFKGDCTLVVKTDIADNKAVLTVSEFLLEINTLE